MEGDPPGAKGDEAMMSTSERESRGERAVRFRWKGLPPEKIVELVDDVFSRSEHLFQDHRFTFYGSSQWYGERAERLMLHWWARGLQALAWERGVIEEADHVPQSPSNPYSYYPDWRREFRSVAQCFEGPKYVNPFIGAKRRVR